MARVRGTMTTWFGFRLATVPPGRVLGLAGGALLAATGAALADPPKLDVELNKLEAQEKGCRAFFVVNNPTTAEFDSYKLDLVLFQPDGVINKRVIVNLAPVRGQKKTVKQFDIEGTPCDQLGSLLVNDVTECKAPGGPVDGCLAGLNLTTLTKVQLSK